MSKTDICALTLVSSFKIFCRCLGLENIVADYTSTNGAKSIRNLDWPRKAIRFQEANDKCTSAGRKSRTVERSLSSEHWDDNLVSEEVKHSKILNKDFKEFVAHPPSVCSFPILHSSDERVESAKRDNIIPVAGVGNLLTKVWVSMKLSQVGIPMYVPEMVERVCRIQTGPSENFVSTGEGSSLNLLSGFFELDLLLVDVAGRQHTRALMRYIGGFDSSVEQGRPFAVEKLLAVPFDEINAGDGAKRRNLGNKEGR